MNGKRLSSINVYTIPLRCIRNCQQQPNICYADVAAAVVLRPVVFGAMQMVITLGRGTTERPFTVTNGAGTASH